MLKALPIVALVLVSLAVGAAAQEEKPTLEPSATTLKPCLIVQPGSKRAQRTAASWGVGAWYEYVADLNVGERVGQAERAGPEGTPSFIYGASRPDLVLDAYKNRLARERAKKHPHRIPPLAIGRTDLQKWQLQGLRIIVIPRQHTAADLQKALVSCEQSSSNPPIGSK